MSLVLIEATELEQLVRGAVRAEVATVTAGAVREVMNLAQASEFLDRNAKLLMKEVKAGLVPAHFISDREPRFLRSELIAYLLSLPKKPKVA